MDRSNDSYEMIKKKIIFEEKIYYHKGNKKSCIGCLVNSKYADQSDHLEFYLFENKTSKGPFICLDLIEYEKAEKYSNLKKENGWWLSRSQRVMFAFELLPKHQQQKETFACETDDNRTKWLKQLNETIEKLKTNENYDNNTYEENISDQADETSPVSPNVTKEATPPVPPKKISSDKTPTEITKRNTKPDSSSKSNAFNDQLNYVLLKRKNVLEKELDENEIIYPGTFEELHKILIHIKKPGVYAVSRKVKPESDCTWAIRVYENDHTPISSWNIYQNNKTDEYSLSDNFDNGLKFSSILELCSYYTKHDLPGEPIVVDRLIVPYKQHYH